MVYRQKGLTQVASGGIDTSASQKVVQEGLQTVRATGKQKVQEIEQADKEVSQLKNTMMSEGLNASSKSMQASYVTFGTDPKGYAKASAKARDELKTVYKDPKEQAYFLARHDLSNSVYQAKVNANYKSSKNKRQKASYARQFDEDYKNIMNTAGLGISSLSSKASPEEKQAATMINSQVNAWYEDRDATDDKGNYIYSTAQRKQIVDLKNNQGKYEVVNFVQGLDPDDKASVNELYSQMTEDKEGFLKQKPMEEDAYQDTLKTLKNMSKGLVSTEMGAKQMAYKSQLKVMYDSFEIGKEGNIKNDEMKNIESSLGYINQVKQGMKSGLINITDGQKLIGKMRPQLDTMIKEEETSKGGWFGDDSNSEYLLDTIKSNPAYRQLGPNSQQEFLEEAYTKVLANQDMNIKHLANDESREFINEMVGKELVSMTKRVMSSSRTTGSSSQSVIGNTSEGLSLLPNGGDDTNGFDLQLGGNLEFIDGKAFIVNKDQAGNILSKRRVSS